MSEMEQKVEAPVKIKSPMDENRLAQLAAARELAVKSRRDTVRVVRWHLTTHRSAVKAGPLCNARLLPLRQCKTLHVLVMHSLRFRFHL